MAFSSTPNPSKALQGVPAQLHEPMFLATSNLLPQLVTCSLCLSSQMHPWLLLHPILRRRLAGRGPLLPQLQSSPGHLQAFVGLGQPATREVVDKYYRKSPDPCPHSQKRSFLDLISSWAPSSCLLGGGKSQKSNKPPNPETAAGVVPCTCEDVDLGCCFKGLPPAHVTPLTVIVTPFASPPMIYHWLPPPLQWAFLVPVPNPKATVCLISQCLV